MNLLVIILCCNFPSLYGSLRVHMFIKKMKKCYNGTVFTCSSSQLGGSPRTPLATVRRSLSAQYGAYSTGPWWMKLCRYWKEKTNKKHVTQLSLFNCYSCECLTHLTKTLCGRKDAQAQWKKDPTSVEAAAIPIFLELLTNLTVDLISNK